MLDDNSNLFAISEERLSRIKNDGGYPSNSIQLCLNQNNLRLADIDNVVSTKRGTTIEGKITISLGAATVEHVMPVFQDLEIAAGALLGLGRISVSVDQRTGTAVWDSTFTSAYGTVDTVNGELAWLYEVEDVVEDQSTFSVKPIPGVLSDVSGAFFNFQPYVAIKWQLLDRVGLRISVGFNKGTIRQGRWILNGRTQVADSQPFSLQGVAFRTMLYLGL